MQRWVPAGLSAVAIIAVFAFLAFWQTTTATAAPTIRYVATFADGGRDVGDCSLAIAPCETPQFAHDRAVTGDEIRVAAGTYTKTTNIAGVETLLRVTKAIT